MFFLSNSPGLCFHHHPHKLYWCKQHCLNLYLLKRCIHLETWWTAHLYVLCPALWLHTLNPVSDITQYDKPFFTMSCDDIVVYLLFSHDAMHALFKRATYMFTTSLELLHGSPHLRGRWPDNVQASLQQFKYRFSLSNKALASSALFWMG